MAGMNLTVYSIDGVVPGTDQLVFVLRHGAGGDLEAATEAVLAALDDARAPRRHVDARGLALH